MSRTILLALVVANIGVGTYFVLRDTDDHVVAAAEVAHDTTQSPEIAAAQAPAIAAVSTRPQFPEPVLVPATDVQTEAVSVDAEPVEEAIRECRVWGPVADPGEFDPLSQALAQTGGLPEIQEIDIQLPPDHLVYVEGLPSLSHARQVAATLREMRIDNYVITREDSGPGVAVGVFSRQELAQKQLQKVSAMGYSVKIATMEKSQKAFNLVAHVTPDSSHYGSSISACMDIAHNP